MCDVIDVVADSFPRVFDINTMLLRFESRKATVDVLHHGLHYAHGTRIDVTA